MIIIQKGDEGITKLLNQITFKIYKRENYFMPAIISQIYNGNLAFNTFMLKILCGMGSDVNQLTSELGLNKSYSNNSLFNKNNAKKMFLDSLIKLISSTNRKAMIVLDDLWDKGEFDRIFVLGVTKNQSSAIFTWLSLLKLEEPIYTKLLSLNKRIKSFSDLALFEFENQKSILDYNNYFEEEEEYVKLYTNNSYTQAERLLINILKKDPLIPFIWEKAGLNYAKQNKMDEALACIRMAIAINHNSPQFFQTAKNIFKQFHPNYKPQPLKFRKSEHRFRHHW